MTTRALTTRDRADLAASILFGAVRVGLGLLWLHEGYVKFRAHFGRADILLVVDGASANSRVPEYFRFVAEHLLRPMADLAGVMTPLTEVALGLVLVLGLTIALPRFLAGNGIGCAVLGGEWLRGPETGKEACVFYAE